MRYKSVFLLISILSVLVLSSCGGKKERPHILLITVDTLRRDHLGVYGYFRDTSPFIDRLAKKGLMFRHAVVPQPLTSPSHASILTSLHPLSHGLTMNGMPLHKNVQTLAEVLKASGYYTVGTVGVKLMAKKFKFARGFDSFSDSWNPGVDFNNKHERTALSVNESLYKQIDTYLSGAADKEKPLFIWVHYFDPHAPYNGRDHIKFKNTPDEGEKQRDKFIRRYDMEVRFTDEHIKKLFAFLAEKGLTERLLTCFTADHGEQLGEHGRFARHADIYSETVFVPLIFHGPGIPKGKTVDSYVSTLDIAPTLLRMLNLEFRHQAEGIDVLNLKGKKKKRKFLVMGNPLYARSLELIGEPYSYILNFDYHYKHWYISGANGISEDRFTSFPGERIKLRKNTAVIPLPHTWKKGRNYMIVRADIKQTAGLSVDIKVRPNLFTGKVPVPNDIRQLNIIYPVTTVDGLVVHLKFKEGNPGAHIKNVRYTWITKDELPAPESVKLQTIENVIYKHLMTPRKKTVSDEFFDLSGDMAMEKNLVKLDKLKPTMIQYRKLIYTAFKYYFKKKDKILKGGKVKTDLTEKEKEMLKSLGYL
jgi:arylsulfatase A-like enzyme